LEPIRLLVPAKPAPSVSVPPPTNVIDSVSKSSESPMVSEIVTPENGVIGASEVVV
jgi:hypothetical protein